MNHVISLYKSESRDHKSGCESHGDEDGLRSRDPFMNELYDGRKHVAHVIILLSFGMVDDGDGYTCIPLVLSTVKLGCIGLG